ncbi:hypothetical protein BD289DRAFT_465831 [Coniella lustricola]|uniref:Rhodopsin domain-containing protein n=1 Tax=Coniella lustricola TaxID=2025994 RepID=A0A2T3AFD3_9PEZI|nr:hypothetical protein BD289DRAFT_465831 [Coniella lustricola]
MASYSDLGGIIAGSVVMWIVAAAAVGLSIYSTRWKHQKFTASVATTALAYPLGATLLDPFAPGSRLNKSKYIQIFFFLMGIMVIDLIKLSVSTLYWNLFGKVRTVRYILIVYMVFIAAWTISFIAAGLAECGNHLPAVFGTLTKYPASCGHAVLTGISLVATDVATDFLTLIIPVPIVLRLQLSTRIKLLSLLTFMIGALAIGGSIAKAYIYIAGSYGQYTEDAILLITGLSIWNLAEVQIGIIAACGPTLRQVLAHIMPTSESVRSPISRMGITQPRSKGSSDLPNFVKMGDSEEQLQHSSQVIGRREPEPSRESLYEMDPVAYHGR